MIHNDLSRTKEFFIQPVKAGRAAREMVLPLNIILLCIVLATIIQQLASYVLQVQSKGYRDAERAKLEASIGPNSGEMQAIIDNVNSFIIERPLIVTMIAIMLAIVMIYALGFVRSRQVQGFDLPAFYSAMARISLVQNSVSAVLLLIGAVAFAISDQVGANFQGILGVFSIATFIWSFFLTQGALDTKSVWGAVGVTIIAAFGVSVIVTFFVMMFMIATL